jgi:hypothetical protein
MRRGRVVLTAASLAALLGCSMVAPFPTDPAEAKKDQPAGDRVAICYDRLASSPAEAQKSAQAQCAPATTAKLVATDYYLDFCPLLLPARATFVCVPQKK